MTNTLWSNALQRFTLNASKSTSGKVLAYISTNKSTGNAGLQCTCSVNYYANEFICWHLYFSLLIKWQLYQQNGFDTPWSVTFYHTHAWRMRHIRAKSFTNTRSQQWMKERHSFMTAHLWYSNDDNIVREWKTKVFCEKIIFADKKNCTQLFLHRIQCHLFSSISFFSCATIFMSLVLFNDHDIFMHVIKMRFAYYRFFDAVTRLCLFILRSFFFLLMNNTTKSDVICIRIRLINRLDKIRVMHKHRDKRVCFFSRFSQYQG